MFLVYGVHPSPQKGCVEEKELEKQLVNIFQEFTLSQQMSDFIQGKLKELFEEDINYQESNEKALMARLAKLKDEKKRLYRKVVNEEIKGEAMAEELKQDIEGEIAQAEEKLGSITQHTRDYLEQTSNLLHLAQNARQLFLEGTREQKNILLNSVASNLFLKDKKVSFSLKKPFDMLANGQKRPIQLRNPSINLACRQTGLTIAFDCIIKAFQNLIWAEQARNRLKQIKLLQQG